MALNALTSPPLIYQFQCLIFSHWK